MHRIPLTSEISRLGPQVVPCSRPGRGEGAMVFTELLARGEGKEKAVSWVAQGRVAGALPSLRLPRLLAWSGERRGEAALGTPRPGRVRGAAAAPAPAPQPRFPAPLLLLSPLPPGAPLREKPSAAGSRERRKKFPSSASKPELAQPVEGVSQESCGLRSLAGKRRTANLV